jgi:hypothetical protein
MRKENEDYLTKKEFYTFVEEELCSRKEMEEMMNKVEKSFVFELNHLRLELKETKINMLQWLLPFMLSIIGVMVAILMKQ